MKLIALVSSGKDSIYSIIECQRFGHEVKIIANLYPNNDSDTINKENNFKNENEVEIDSYMFQSIGSSMIQSIAECMKLPLYRKKIKGKSICHSLEYEKEEGDEVEDLYQLLSYIKKQNPDIQGVCSGAIFSNFQRNRVEDVCNRLGLVSISYLWRRNQKILLQEMIENNINAILVKVASIGLHPKKHLGKSISELSPYFHNLNEKYKFHVCGEGGEYETLTLDCPLFLKRIVIDESEIIIHSDDMFAPVAFLKILKYHLEDKNITKGSTLNNFKFIDVDKMMLTTKFKNSTIQDDLILKSPSFIPKIRLENNDINGCCKVKFKNYKKYRNAIHIGQIKTECSEADVNSLINQTNNVFDQIENIAENEGFSLTDVYFVHVYLKDMNNFNLVNDIYKKRFKYKFPPSRCCIELDLDHGCQVMMDLMVLTKSMGNNYSKNKKECLHVQSISKWAPTCIGPYSQANTLFKSIIYLSGQIGLQPTIMTLSEGLNRQTVQTFANVSNLLEAVHSNKYHIITTIIYLNIDIVDTNNAKKSNDANDLSYEQFIRSLMTIQHSEESKNINKSELDTYENDEYNEKTIVSDNSSIQIIYVQNLPKNARMEAEIVAFTKMAYKHLEPLHNDILITKERFSFRTRSISVKRLFNLTTVKIDKNTEEFLFTDFEEIVETMLNYAKDEIITKYNLKWENFMAIRIYYTKKIENISENNWNEILTKKFQIITKFHDNLIPAIIVIPAERVVHSCITFQLSFYDYDKLETDMWLHKQI